MSSNPWMGVRLPVPGPLEQGNAREWEQFYVAKVRQECSEAIAQMNQYGPNPQAMVAALTQAQQHFHSYGPLAADLASKGCPGLTNLLQQIESDIQTALGVQRQSVESTQKTQLDSQKALADAAAQAAQDLAQSAKETNDRIMQAIRNLSPNSWE